MGELTAALGGLDADVIALQECPARELVVAAADELGMHLAWFPACWPGDAVWVGGFPGAILSRWPLEEARDEVTAHADLDPTLFNRHWGSARVMTPGGPLLVHAYHCCSDFGGEFKESVRCAEIEAVLAAVGEDHAQATVLLGDHNADPGSAPLALLAAAGFVDAHAAAGTGDGFSCQAIEPSCRIDQCWLRGCRALRCAVQGQTPFGRRVDETAPALSDHLPLMVELVIPGGGSRP
jgi:endonuclease/exonuclease/phosphatase family metal-dependent hydrolase